MVVIDHGKIYSDIEWAQKQQQEALDRQRIEAAQKPSFKGFIDFYRNPDTYRFLVNEAKLHINRMKKTKVKDIVKKK
ncbi:MAG: hypothetical protein M1477_05720 [Candidatus Thermoplasmatota archaeon]|nr:hypothetical protein [Candidatus Thermoplasmatota archaeon]